MIKLQTKAPSAHVSTAVRIETLDCSAAINVAVDEKPVRKQVGDNWVEDPERRRQLITWVTPGGAAVELSGVVDEKDAIDLQGGKVGRVVADLELGTTVLAAFEKGGKSRDVVTVQVKRILQLWETPEKALYSHPDYKAGK